MSASRHSSSRDLVAYFGRLLRRALYAVAMGVLPAAAAGGDLLRGGYTGNPGRSANPASLTPPAESQAWANMADALARTTQAIDAVRGMQSAARAIAVSAGANNLGINPNNLSQQLPNVPNGLGVSGLNPAAGQVWTGASQPAQALSNGRTVVTVDQNAPDATLTWTTFNVGSATTLKFDQSKTGADAQDSIVFNIIDDPGGAPSQILGSIQAPGQVYVIDQNGIIFGGASQINVHTLVASSLPINTNLISRGLLNNPDDQFLFSQIAIPAGANGPTPAFTPPQPVNGTDGAVTVEPGAQITAPASADSTGGRVALIGPDVINAGTISTPDGQTILAAGEQVGFLASTDPTLRGLLTYIGAVGATDGYATNTGLIDVPSGEATIAGKDVNQLGEIAASTSVTLNGRIDLDAAYGTKVVAGLNNTDLFAPAASGMVTLGPGSVMDILPDLSSPDTVAGTTLALLSEINIEGETIHFESDSQILAPGADVTASAGGWYQQGVGQAQLIPDSGQVYFDAGASIDVAGSIVSAPVSQNIVSAELLGPQLADSPLQRNGVLYGQTVQVDARETGIYDGTEWVGTPLANVSGYIALIQLPVGELTTGGGTVALSAGGSVVMQPGSEIDVSGGAINYQGGMVQTTDLLSGGHIINIADATPDLVYQGILGTYTVDYAKWGIEQTYTTPLVGGAYYQSSYTEGGAGGAINISAPAMALDGQLLGKTISGPRQLQIPATPSSLALSFQLQTTSGAISALSPTPPHIYFEEGASLPAAGAFSVDSSGDPAPLPADRQDEVILSPDLLTDGGFGGLTINDGAGDVTVPAGVALTAPDWGSITIAAANLDIDGSVTAPDGTLSFTAYNYSPYAWLTYPAQAAPPAPAPGRGQFVLGPSASLSTEGLIVDDRIGSNSETAALATGGGAISITSYSADFEAGSSINVSGGVSVGPANAISYGAGGSLSIAAGRDPESQATIGGQLILDAVLDGFSGSKGGSLSILAPAVQVGGGAPADADTLVLDPSFFGQGGFASFSLSGLGNATANSASTYDFLPGVAVAPGSVISPLVENWTAAIDASQGVTLTPVLLPEAQRTPISIALDAVGVSDANGLVIRGDLVIGAGSVIATDPGGSVSLAGNTVAVLGSVLAPGGSISIKGAADSSTLFNVSYAEFPQATVYLGAHVLLSTAGATMLTPDAFGLPTGSVLPGGNITVSGNIVAAPGAVLDVSGASGNLYLPESETVLSGETFGSFLGGPETLVTLDSNGGTITLAGAEELFTDATLTGAAGGPSAVGGSLVVSSGLYVPPNGSAAGSTATSLIIAQTGPAVPVASGIGKAVLGTNGQVLDPLGQGHIAVNSFGNGGFDNVTLAGNVQFDGNVAITAGDELSVGNGGVITANGAVSLSAPYVALGQSFLGPLTDTEEGISPFGEGVNIRPTFGAGSLTVTADLIDIGNLSLQGIGAANFMALNGDIRGDGTIDIQGHITLDAGQIYPPTETIFSIDAYDYGGTVGVASSGAGSSTVILESRTLPAGFGVGSTLLGAAVESIDGTTVTLASGADAAISAPAAAAFTDPGTVTIDAGGARDLPLSAGGVLDVYASVIDQDGVLRAPMGTINLGWNAANGTAPVDWITGAPVDSTASLTLGSRSVTSVSAVDPATGQTLIIPYGLNPTGSEWVDPAGNNITAGGVPEKSINIAGGQIDDQKGSVIDLAGGGNLSSYEFISGEGGTTDFLNPGTAWAAGTYTAGELVTYKGVTYVALQQTGSEPPAVNQYWGAVPASYAVIPGYQAGYAPYSAFNSATGDAGYVSPGLQVGGQVYLGGGSGLAPGVYTLLPARYALLPGAYLVTPESQAPAPGQTLPDGSNLVSGYLFNGLSNPGGLPGAKVSEFQVDSQAVVQSRGQYVTFLGDAFFAEGAARNKTAAPELPIDAGQVNFDAASSLVLEGNVDAQAPAGGSAGYVGIDSSLAIDITGGAAGTGGGQPGELTLNAAELSSFGAANLVIGGSVTTGADGPALNVETDDVTLESGATLTGGDIILLANDDLDVKQDARISAAGDFGSQPAALQVQGDGVLVQASGGPATAFTRSGVTSSEAPGLTIGAGATISGASVTLDSTYGTTLDPAAHIVGKAITVASGQISIELEAPAMPPATAGLVLSGPALENLEAAQSLSLASYSSIDLYGAGQVGSAKLNNLSLDAAEIRGFDTGSGLVTVEAGNIVLGNGIGGTAPGAAAPQAGAAIEFDGRTIGLGAGQMDIDQFSTVRLNASGEVLAEASGGLAAQDALAITAPLTAGMAQSDETISAAGALTLASTGAAAKGAGGLDASLTLEGASVTDNGDISTPSGKITLIATSGDVTVGNLSTALLDAAGTEQYLTGQTEYTSGGTITLSANSGSVFIDTGATINVAASASSGANAGILAINTPDGSVSLNGTLLAAGGGHDGSFSLDAGSIPGGSVEAIDDTLAAAHFDDSISIRDEDDAAISVDGVATAQTYDLSADAGSITVTGEIDASGETGGTINLIASGSVILDPGSELTVAGNVFNAAGQGGSVSLQAGAYTGGNFTNVALGSGPQVNIGSGSVIDLSVAANSSAVLTAENAALGDFSGKLLISAPQALGNQDLQVQPIDGMIKNASSIIVEGVQIFQAADGSVDNQEAGVQANGDTFAGAAGATTASYTAMTGRLFADNMGLITPSGGSPAVAVIEPGAEIVNPGGSLTLANDWDLSSFRFGPDSAPGVLTVRASGNLIFDGALSDGFNPSSGELWEATLLAQNPLLPVNAQAWSYNLTAGADFTGASAGGVIDGAGSLELGILDPSPYATRYGPTGTTASAVAGYYQVIRTGAGDIDISAGSNVELLNQFATIYTAGTQVADPTLGGAFSVPVLDESKNPRILGTLSRTGYPAQYSEAGGNVTIAAGEDIEHLTELVPGGPLVMDSESELPDNWLYRRGAVAATGLFDSNPNITGGDPSESTTWWVDFSNFFEGVGALGGGNVTMIAGNDIANVDAVIPTNARMPGIDPSTGLNVAPDAGSLVELGGGDLLVQAGDDINAGVYYVESGSHYYEAGSGPQPAEVQTQGHGTLIAGNQILTNSTRSPVGGFSSSQSGSTSAPPEAWLPATLFAGDSSFDVAAGGDILLGPVANPFMLPEGLANSIWYKTYFSTYGADDSVDVTSLGGDVTLREYAEVSDINGPILQAWLENMDLMNGPVTSRAYYQPWLRLDETTVSPFTTMSEMMPPTLAVSAFSGDINIVGNLLLSPSPAGTVDLAASGSINGFQLLGAYGGRVFWTAATIDISDADPASAPGIASPLAYQEVAGIGTNSTAAESTNTGTDFQSVFDDLFDATNENPPGVAGTEEELHDPGLLHAADPNPVQLDAMDGSVSGLTLYSPAETQVIAGGDITDVDFYLQNDQAGDVSVVSAGGDIVLYDPASPERELALADPDSIIPASLPGDIRIAGPGALEVLAGGDLELGGEGPGGATNSSGDGIASIGNTDNPALPFAGADVIAAAGLGGAGSGDFDFSALISQFIEAPAGAAYLAELSQITSSAPAGLDAATFSKLPRSQQDLLALDVFFLALRDAGRDHNVSSSPGYGHYSAGYAAIAALFPKAGSGGNIDLTSREVVTESGGNIEMLAPNGYVTVGLNSSAGNNVTNLGVITQDGGNISIFASGGVNVGTSRIFTLRGGNEVIWSTAGNIDAGASSKTVQSAPPTRVLVDPQSANVRTDLAGLATGGGIGVLASVAGVAPGNVDLIAPAGAVNAGEAGIRATGNLNIAAVQILNASNISAGGATAGLPPPVAAPNIGALAAASSAAGSAIGASSAVTAPAPASAQESTPDSVVTVEVLGYGGGDTDEDPAADQNSQSM